MGKLLDPPFWRNAIDQLWNVRPVPGKAMKRQEVSKFFEIACRALNDVIHDSEYEADATKIEEAHRRFVEGAKGINLEHMRSFIDACIAFDAPLVRQSGFSEAQAVAILSRMHELANYMANPEFSRDGFDERLSRLHEFICGEASNPPSEKADIDKIGATIDAFSGFALISIDITKAGLGDFLGLASVGGGVACLWKAAQPFFKKT